MTVGEKIQQRRKEKGWSQEDLAEQVGVSRQSISLWEKDQTTPSLENMKTLCRLFQISMDELLGQTPLPSPTQPPPPPAMVTTHWSPAFLKRALGMLHRKYLAVTLGFAVSLMVLGILFAVLGWAAGEDYGANLAGFLFYSLIFWVFWLLRRIQIQRVVKRHTALYPNHVTTLEFYPGYIHIQSRSDRSSSSNDWSYQSLKAVRCDGEIIVLQGPESMNAFYLADLQGDALWALSALKANAKKYSAPNWLLPNRLPVKHPMPPGLKGKRYYLWKNILLVLFIASLGCLLFAMPLCALLSRLGGLPEFTRYLWGFYLLLPIPVASILLGCWGIRQGIPAKKNVIAGAIMAVLLVIYGSIGFLSGGAHSWDPAYYTQAQTAAKIELPEAVSVDTLAFQPLPSPYYPTVLSSSAVTYSPEIAAQLSHSLPRDSLWSAQTEDSIQEILPIDYRQPWGPSLLYCVELDGYNTAPEEFGEYNFYYFTYDESRGRMLVVHFRMELSQQTLEYRNYFSAD